MGVPAKKEGRIVIQTENGPRASTPVPANPPAVFPGLIVG